MTSYKDAFEQGKVLLIDKPLDWTSFDAVNKIRNLLRIKKVGHAGTLDPLATGLLIIGIGKATKELGQMLKMEKTYEAVIRLGVRSDTDDRTGRVQPLAISHKPSADDVRETLQKFMGQIEQIPPAYSAKKIGGKKFYELARRGEEVPRKPVQVTIHEINLLSYQWPLIKIRVRVSSGTYIRALARDIGEDLGVGGLLEELIRTQIGQYLLQDAVDPRELDRETLKRHLSPSCIS